MIRSRTDALSLPLPRLRVVPGLGCGLLCGSKAWDGGLAPNRASLPGKERTSSENGAEVGQRERRREGLLGGRSGLSMRRAWQSMAWQKRAGDGTGGEEG